MEYCVFKLAIINFRSLKMCFSIYILLSVLSSLELHAESINKSSSLNPITTLQRSNIAPKASRKPLNLTLHNDTRIDNYAWLRDPKWPEVKDQEIINYMNEEKKYTEAFFKPLNELQEKLYQEIEMTPQNWTGLTQS